MTRPILNSTFLDDPTFKDNTLLDDSRRVKWNRSGWGKLCHFFEKRNLDNKLQDDLQQLFSCRYGFEDPKNFKKIWSKISGEVWSINEELTIGKLRAIDEQFKTHLVYHGPGILRQSSSDFASSNVDARVSEVVKALLHGGKVTSSLKDKALIKAVFVKHDPELMKAFATEMQAEFNSLLANPPKSESEALLWRAFHGNLISLLPYVYPPTGTTLMIPFLKNDLTCQSVNYDLEVIDLLFDDKSSPMTALGFTPKDHQENVPTYISFLGTTFPAASGFAATVLSDFTPGNSVGEAVFSRNKDKLEKWMRGKEGIHAYGMSLGGAMCFHMLKNFSENLSSVNAFVPAGLYPENWQTPLSPFCKVNIYCQSGDLVSWLGSFPTSDNVSLFEVYSHQNVFKENMINSHVRAFTGCDQVTLLKIDPIEANRSYRRLFLTKMHKFLGPLLVYLPAKFSLFLYNLGSKISSAVAKVFKR